MMKTILMALILFAFPKCSQPTTAEAAPDTAKLKVPPGYRIELWQDGVPGARSMTLGAKGTLFVGTRGSEVYAIRDHKRYTIAKGLEQPNGVAFRNGDLYVAEVSRILRYPDIEGRLEKPPAPQVLYDKLPGEKHHGWKFIAFGPDGALYVPVGAPCNVCKEKDPRFASILRFERLDGPAPEVYAAGVRNTVGFDWNPATKDLWFTDNGRDLLGDDVPDDELNAAPKSGMHFGFPYCHAGEVADPEFGRDRPCRDFTPPRMKLGAHVAALGMRFLDADTALVALHGSWNRSGKSGYRVDRIEFKDGKPVRRTPFVEGFLQPNEKVVGRPVDVQVLPDDSVLVSDDDAGRIYRVFRSGPSP